MTELLLPHPDLDQLRAFSLGRLDDEAASTWISAHIDTCVDCGRTLETVAGDTLEQLLRSADMSVPGAAPTQEPPPNLLDHPRYQIEERIGAGGMGTVYKARHKLMEREVALKVIHSRLMQKPAAIERFRREVKAAARLTHPNIVTAYDAEQGGDLHFLVMEFVPGGSLAQVINDRGTLPIGEALDTVRQAALGLQHAHEQGMVHRDIKPANLMAVGGVMNGGVVSDRGASGAKNDTAHSLPLALYPATTSHQIKILDFGLARMVSELRQAGSLTEDGSIMGTPDYIAPEQANDSHQADIRADIYSLGCTLYHLLAGQPPFPTGTILQKLIAHQTRQARPLRELRPEVPLEVVRVVERMMAKDPGQRYQTPVEVAQALGRISDFGFGISDCRLEEAPNAVRLPTSPLQTARRRVTVLAAVGLLVAVAGVGTLFGGQIIRFVTGQGELIVVVDDPTIEIEIVQNGVEVQDKTSQRNFTLSAVEGEIEVLEINGIKRTTKQFELTRGGTTTVKVTLDELADLRRPKDAVAAVKKGPPAVPASADADRRAAEYVLSIGGTIKIMENGQQRQVAAVGDLPLGVFELTAADFNDNQKATDAGLAHLKHCKNVTYLDLRNTQVSDAGLAHFKDYENVTDLDLGNTRVSDAGLADLENLPRLARLGITNTRISQRGYEQLHTTIPSCAIIWFEANWSVAHIVLSLGGSVVIGTPGQPESRGVNGLEDLPLDYFQVRRVSLAGVAKASYNKANTLGTLCERMSCLRFVEFDRLESLDLLGITALNHSSRGYSFLADIHGLEELSLAKAGMNDVFLAKLPKLPALKRLVLDGNVVRGPGLTYLRELPELTDVSLGCSTLRDLSAKYLAELKQVKRLSLAGSGLTDAGIKHLAALAGLETLDLRGTKATAAGVAELQAALPKCRIEWDE